jgi:maleate isomerase
MAAAVRLGFLIPPGNPVIEGELFRLAPEGVSVHFDRMVTSGNTGSHQGQEERNRDMIAGLDQNVAVMALVKPRVIVLAHTASSYTLGKDGEAKLVERLTRASGTPFITAFGSVLEALAHLGVQRVALGTPYSPEATGKSKAYLEQHGLEVVSSGSLDKVVNIYDETLARAESLARRVDAAAAQAVFLSGVGMPTVDVIDKLERALGKPVISSTQALMWNALRVAKAGATREGFGRLLSGR